MGICDNTPGSYSCRCPPGYNLGTDGRTCQDVDECTTQHICQERNEICTNTRGSYRCTRVHCPPDYIIDTERKKLVFLIEFFVFIFKCIFQSMQKKITNV